jgi:hypothetical protein
MNIIDTEAFAKQLKVGLQAEGLAVPTLRTAPHSGGGVHAEIDGDRCITNIGLWPNGLFDVEYISLPSQERTFIHREFNSENEALRNFIEEVRCAVERA